MKSKNIALLIIDGQNDFMDLPKSTLPVPGACKDMDRVIAFIQKNTKEIDNITCTLDSHRTIDISHPVWWEDAQGKLVSPFTPISNEDVKKGVYIPRFQPQWSRDYVDQLETQGEFGHLIWPYHCLIGSEGTALYGPLHKAINVWEVDKSIIVQYVTKGDNSMTEHFGAFRANIEMPMDPKTQFNQGLIKNLLEYEAVYLAGEARNFCVVNSLRQAITEVPDLAKKLIILEDCMSDVPGMTPAFCAEVDAIYLSAKAQGARFAKSTDSVLQAV